MKKIVKKLNRTVEIFIRAITVDFVSNFFNMKKP